MEPTTENPNFIPSPEVEGVGKAESALNKKAFVEPEVSFPVDVLEATTFFQLADSGGTT